MKYRNQISYILFFVSFIVGYKYSIGSLRGQVTARLYIQGRLVADTLQPVKRPLLIDPKLISEDNVIKSTTVTKNSSQNYIGLKFGNYVTEYGQSLCSAYNRVEVVLFGDGVAVSGNPPRMIFTGDCPNEKTADMEELSDQVRETFPLFLISDCNSLSKIPDHYELENGTSVIATNIDFMLSEPKWILEKLTFSDETNPLNSLEFNFEEIKKIRSDIGLITVECN